MLPLLVGAYSAPRYTGGPIFVRPTFVIPSDRDDLAVESDAALLTRHLVWAQRSYAGLLRGDTFRIAPRPLILRLKVDSAALRKVPGGFAGTAVREAMAAEGLDRWNTPYVYLTIFEGIGPLPPHREGGRPINGGHGTGGGVVTLSAETLRGSKNFQTALQQTLGLAFGLTFVDSYGYDVRSNPSIMSRDPRHSTRGFDPAPKPGIFIPEDLRAIGQNRWAFSTFRFRPELDIPRGYRLRREASLPPMEL